MVSQSEILDMFKNAGGILEGHFLLTSGLHSGKYVQCARVLQYPGYAERLGAMIAKRFSDRLISVVVSPAVGGIIIGHEVARSLSVRAIFTERVEGEMVFRRGFSLKGGERALVVEDVTTTGGSVREVAELIFKLHCKVEGIASIIDRTGGIKILDGVEQYSLLNMDIPVYKDSECPLCEKGIPIEKPGSREIL